MRLYKKTPTKPLLDPTVVAQINAGLSTTQSKANAYLGQNYNNSTLGLKDANGKLLPGIITGQQFQDALKNVKYNGQQIDYLKSTLFTTPNNGLPTNYKATPTGQINKTEIDAITSFQKKIAANTPVGQTVDYVGGMQAIKSGTFSGLGTASYPNTTYSTTSINQPNIEASKATINDIFLGYLGRTATDKELQTYTQKYLDYAKAHPTSQSAGSATYEAITTPSGGTGKQKATQTSKDVTTNLNETDFIKNQVRSSGEYNAFQAAGTAFDVLKKMAQKDSGAQ